MEEMTVSEISSHFGISTRMLRYYEQAGLIKNFRRDGYAYRMYDETAAINLRQIMILRKLRIPLKQIKSILQKPEAVTAIEVFRQNISELEDEINELSAIKNILCRFVIELQKTSDVQFYRFALQDAELLRSIESLSCVSINFKEDQRMEPMKKSEKNVSKLKDVRIVYLPPACVAAAHYIGDDPEGHAYEMMGEFLQRTKLFDSKPDLRNYGFNHPNPRDETDYHGYEIWVTIPEDLEVTPPLVKKHFAGGLYASHMIPMGNFNEWEWLFEWVEKSDKYKFAGDLQDQDHMCGLLEEHLNYVSHIREQCMQPEDMQLDLLMPIEEI